jgi:nucleoside recognition membrane protein YjiH
MTQEEIDAHNGNVEDELNKKKPKDNTSKAEVFKSFLTFEVLRDIAGNCLDVVGRSLSLVGVVGVGVIALTSLMSIFGTSAIVTVAGAIATGFVLHKIGQAVAVKSWLQPV